MADANIKAVITADDRASDTLKRFGDNAGKLGSKVKAGLKAAAVGIATAGAAAVAFGVSSVKSYMESENALAQLNATLKSTKGVAGITAKSAVNLANSLQKVTKFSDEDVLSAENLLLTFTKIGKDIFPQATKTVLDMSTALGQDTKSSAIQLGKALQDPILGVTALRRVGVNFNKEQQEVIKNLVETGQSAKAQKMILKELSTEFGGSATAAGKTFSGRLEILKNQFDEVKESIGGVIIGALTPLTSKLAEFVASDKFQDWIVQLNQWLKVNLPIAINYVTQTLIPSLINIFKEIWPVIKTTLTWGLKFVEFLSENKVALWGFIAVLGTLKAAFVINRAIQSFSASLSLARKAYTLTAKTIGSPIHISIVVGAALIAMQLIIDKGNETIGVLNDLKDAQTGGVRASEEAGIKGMQRLLKEGTPAQKKRAKNFFAKKASGDYATGGFTGRGSATDVAGIVHKGEYVIPKSQVDQNTGTPKVGNTTINISVNAGAYMGSQQDARRYAQVIAESLKDIASMKGVKVMEMLG